MNTNVEDRLKDASKRHLELIEKVKSGEVKPTSSKVKCLYWMDEPEGSFYYTLEERYSMGAETVKLELQVDVENGKHKIVAISI